MPGPSTGFTRTASEERYRGQFLHVECVTIASDRGDEFTREVLRQREAAAVLPFDAGDVILIRQYRAAIDALSIEIPAGVCDRPGEGPEKVARRECAEEVGYLPGALVPLASVHPAPGYVGELVHLYLGLDLQRRRRAPDGPEEAAAQVLRVRLGEAVAMVARGEITNAATVAALYAVTSRRDELPGL